MTNSAVSHACPVSGCGVMIPKAKVVCGKCWALVPEDTQRLFVAARDRRNVNFFQARKELVKAIGAARNPKKASKPEESIEATVAASSTMADVEAITHRPLFPG